MAKPIAVMYIPTDGAFYVRGDDAQAQLMRILNCNYGQPLEDPDLSIPDYWKDYYWFVFTKRGIEEPELQVFYEKDFTPIKFEELKKFIEDSLKAKSKQL